MRLIKLALISIVILFLLVTAISLMIPSRVRISRAVDLSQSGPLILGYIRDQGQWKEWNGLARTDSAGRTPPVFRLQFASDSDLVYRIQQPERRDIINVWKLHRYTGSDSLTLQWYMDFQLGWWPWQKFGSLFYEATYGKMMEKGLNDLKGRLEGAR